LRKKLAVSLGAPTMLPVHGKKTGERPPQDNLDKRNDQAREKLYACKKNDGARERQRKSTVLALRRGGNRSLRELARQKNAANQKFGCKTRNGEEPPIPQSATSDARGKDIEHKLKKYHNPRMMGKADDFATSGKGRWLSISGGAVREGGGDRGLVSSEGPRQERCSPIVGN